MDIVYRSQTESLQRQLNKELKVDLSGRYEAWSHDLIKWCEAGGWHVGYAAAWALAWLGKVPAVSVADRPRALRALLKIWRFAPEDVAQRLAAWAFCETPEISRETRPLGELNSELSAFIEEQFELESSDGREDRRPAAVILAYYLEGPWSDKKLVELLSSPEDGPGSRVKFVARALGVELPAGNE
jgi:hypothetical protein